MPLHLRARARRRVEETKHRQPVVEGRRANAAFVHVELERPKLFRRRAIRRVPQKPRKYIVCIFGYRPLIGMSSRNRRRSAGTNWFDIETSCRQVEKVPIVQQVRQFTKSRRFDQRIPPATSANTTRAASSKSCKAVIWLFEIPRIAYWSGSRKEGDEMPVVVGAQDRQGSPIVAHLLCACPSMSSRPKLRCVFWPVLLPLGPV